MFQGKGVTVRLIPTQQLYDGKFPIKVLIEATTTEKSLDVDQIYLNVQAVEEIRFRNAGSRNRHPSQNYGGYRTESVTTHQVNVQVTGPLHIPAHGVYEWEAEFQIPPNANGTYKGHNANHIWSVRAGMDSKGIDPKSKWIILEISNPF
ncbi:MAG: hypothetical protein AAGK97_03465 [Bacteroidota bacterium]